MDIHDFKEHIGEIIVNKENVKNIIVIDSRKASRIGDNFCMEDDKAEKFADKFDNIILPFNSCVFSVIVNGYEDEEKTKRIDEQKLYIHSYQPPFMDKETLRVSVELITGGNIKNDSGTLKKIMQYSQDVGVTFICFGIFLHGVKTYHCISTAYIFVNRFGKIIVDTPLISTNTNLLMDGVNADFTKTISTILWRIMFVISLMNCKNIELRKTHYDMALNKKRIRSGRVPLDSYYEIVIENNHQQKNGENLSTYQNRLHLCRGHFKNRKTGKFWWGCHTRGSADIGRIKKDYVA
jgi:hypothetical protein